MPRGRAGLPVVIALVLAMLRLATPAHAQTTAGLYVSVDAGTSPPAAVTFISSALNAHLRRIGFVLLAPAGETPPRARAVLAATGRRGVAIAWSATVANGLCELRLELRDYPGTSSIAVQTASTRCTTPREARAAWAAMADAGTLDAFLATL